MNPNRTLEFKPAGDATRLDGAVDSEARKNGGHRPRRRPRRRLVKSAWFRRLRRRSAAAEHEHGEHRLSANDERALAARIKAGDVDAGQQLITANLGLVFGAVGDYKQCGVPLDDLIQEGNLGLIRAARHFDPSIHTARFATYATYWIRCFMVRALASSNSRIQHPESMRLLRIQYRRAMDELHVRRTDASGRPGSKPPGLDESAGYAGGQPGSLELARLIRSERAIHQRLDEQTLAGGPAPDQDVVVNEDRALLHAAILRLSPFEAWVICERFGLGRPSSHGKRTASGREPAQDTHKQATASGPASAAPSDGAQPGDLYFQRSYIDMGRDCGLSVFRLHQVEQTALEKLRAFLGHRVAEGT